uniref:Uncharacterized protein n=1 Tax=Nosema pernyi TaxID=1112939 RepID=X5DYL5_9MICR|nr:hypothetical protein NP_c15 [Nosema pernyi]
MGLPPVPLPLPAPIAAIIMVGFGIAALIKMHKEKKRADEEKRKREEDDRKKEKEAKSREMKGKGRVRGVAGGTGGERDLLGLLNTMVANNGLENTSEYNQSHENCWYQIESNLSFGKCSDCGCDINTRAAPRTNLITENTFTYFSQELNRMFKAKSFIEVFLLTIINVLQFCNLPAMLYTEHEFCTRNLIFYLNSLNGLTTKTTTQKI